MDELFAACTTNKITENNSKMIDNDWGVGGGHESTIISSGFLAPVTVFRQV